MRSITTLLLISAVISSCGRLDQNHVGPEEISKLKAFGRKVHFDSVADYGLGLSLTDSGLAIVKSHSDDRTGALTWALFDTEQMSAVADNRLQEEATAFLSRYADVFQVPASELKPMENSIQYLTPSVTAVNFSRSHDGWPVRDAFVTVTFGRDQDGQWRLREVLNRSYGSFRIANEHDAVHTVSPASWGLDETLWSITKSERQVIGRRGESGTLSFYRARQYTLTNAESDETLIVTVADGSREPLEAYSSRLQARHTVTAKVLPRSYTDKSKLIYNLLLTTVKVGSGNKVTDLDGALDLEEASQATTVTLTSRRVKVVEGKNGRSPISLTLSAQNEGSLMVDTTDKDHGRAANAYSAIHRINQFSRKHLDEGEVDILSLDVTVRINVDGECNAYFETGQNTISLFKEGGGCANTSELNDVIYHEWGHGLDAHTGRRKGINDGAYSEGIGDILAAYYNGDAGLSPDFKMGTSKPIRNLDNSRRYPDDQGEVHEEGLIIGGAFWDLREGLIDKWGEVKGKHMAEFFFFRHLLTSDSYKEAYEAVLRLDDDDGNPATDSPNHCVITAAFAAHGLAEAEQDCTDQAIQETIPLGEDLFLGVKEATQTGLIFMAAATDADQMELCLGDRKTCTETTEGQRITLAIEGVANGKTFFLASAPLTVKNLQRMTLIAKDENGLPLSAREVQTASK